jgi:hypothetical protein
MVIHDLLGRAMKWILRLAALALALSGCVAQRPPVARTIHVREVSADADNSQQWRPIAFKVGTQRFGTLEGFQAFVAALLQRRWCGGTRVAIVTRQFLWPIQK